jgi:osmotically-inducible protein OsmY
MKDLPVDIRSIAERFQSVAPNTSSEFEQLAISIRRAVQRETNGAIRDLSVEVESETVFLRGRCPSYYHKQLAQHAAMCFPGSRHLTNQIEVG